jgi:hypothetical protein
MGETLEHYVRNDRGVYRVGAEEFGSNVDLANIFGYLAGKYELPTAQAVIESLKSKLSNKGIAWEVLKNAGKSAGDVLQNVALALGGLAWMRGHASTNPWWNPYSPRQDTDQYVIYVIISWGNAPWKPIYHTIADNFPGKVPDPK